MRYEIAHSDIRDPGFFATVALPAIDDEIGKLQSYGRGYPMRNWVEINGKQRVYFVETKDWKLLVPISATVRAASELSGVSEKKYVDRIFDSEIKIRTSEIVPDDPVSFDYGVRVLFKKMFETYLGKPYTLPVLRSRIRSILSQ